MESGLRPISKTFVTGGWLRKNGALTQINDLWLKGAPKDAKRDAGNTCQ